MRARHLLLPLAFGLLLSACRKETELVPDNQPPDYDGVPTVITQN